MTYFPSPCLYIHINSQRNPILTTRPSSCHDATKYQTEKWLQSFGLPTWHPLPDPFNSRIKHRPCRIAPKEIKSNKFALYIPGQIAHFRLAFPYMWNSFFWSIFCGYTVTQLVKETNLGDIERTWVVIFFERFKFYTILDYVSCAQSPQLS